MLALDQAVHIDAGQVDVIGVKAAGRHDLFYFHHADFAAHGGTNFSMLEMLRDSPERQASYGAMAHIGHDLEEMIDFYNTKYTSLLSPTSQQVIVSGGVQNFLDGYYFTQKIKAPALYGQASALLRHARISYDSLHEYVLSQVEGLKIAYGYLRIKP